MRGDSPPGAYADPASPRVALHALPEQTSAVQAAASRIKDLLDMEDADCTGCCMQMAKTKSELLWLRTDITHALQHQLSPGTL